MKRPEIIFENLINIAGVIVKTFGRNCEVAVHDFKHLPNSLIYIEGTLTGRKPGSPITDLVVRALRREGNDVNDICNYKTVAKNGRILKSSTAFIRNSKGKVVGAFCINFCLSEYLDTLSLIEDFIKTSQLNENSHMETFASSLSETIESLMEVAIKKVGKQPAAMTKGEKINLISNLEFHGAFLIKGAVDFVAKRIGVSKFTVYNYLKEVRSDNNL